MTKPKAILGTRFPYLYWCKSANMTCNMHAQCSSEHAQPLVMVNALVTRLYYLSSGITWRYIIFSCLQGKKENVTKHYGQGCCGKQPFKVVYIWTCILTEPQPMEVSARSAELCRANTWAPGLCQLLEGKRCCDVKKENKHCENFGTKPFSQR